ncbi:GNAT family N-acetyltransferase [Streptomyces sp. SCSIO 30461]|uniref:GNAT family N-acetyltransferase n=1 Tax=Streptomyces sp. SCSIO 30461 TaxID=3118085 RepID=UPI0030D609FA
MTGPEVRRINAFVSAFARRRAAHAVDVPGGFAVYDDAFAHSHADNQVVIDSHVDPEALPAIAEETLGHLPHRMISVLGDEAGTACAGPLIRAGYAHSTGVVMLHTGSVPPGGTAEEVDLDTLRAPLTRSWRGFLPDVADEVVRQLVDRREARRRGAHAVHFIGARTEEGEVASWADLYVDPATGIAQIEDLVTSEAHLRRGHADAVLGSALRLAADAGCGTRFLLADAVDWPRHWYERRGFSVVGRTHWFERV